MTPSPEAPRVPETALREAVRLLFEKMGVPDADSRRASDVLVTADLRGVESHGVSNMLRKYVRDYKAGVLNPAPSWKVVRESAATASIDCDRGLGIIMAPRAMELAIEKAKKTGIGMVTMKNVGHMGMVSYYAMQALPHNMIGVAMTSTAPEVVPTFGKEPRLGTNPIALAAPAGTEAPFVYDAATSVISSNKIGLARRTGAKLAPGWVADEKGVPQMREVDADISGYGGSEKPSLLPLGSTPGLSSHKGYGLGGVVEILSGILAGAGASAVAGKRYAHMVAAYDVNAFMDAAQFKNDMDEWLRALCATTPSEGCAEVLYPGLPEARCEKENREKGIPLHPEVLEWFRAASKELSVPCPV